VHFILTSERPDSLLPTIRSRCQRIRFGRLPNAVLRDILQSAAIPEDHIAPAIALSANRADVALALGSDGTVDLLIDLMMSVDDAVRASGPGALVELSEQLARRDDLDLVLLTLETFYRDLAMTSLGLPAEGLGFSARGQALHERSASISPSASAARVSLIHQCVRSMQQNANRQVALDALLFGLRNLR